MTQGSFEPGPGTVSIIDTATRTVVGEPIAVGSNPFRIVLQPTLALTVAIGINPGSFPNNINLSSSGVVPVAILSSTTFDATRVNPESVTLAAPM